LVRLGFWVCRFDSKVLATFAVVEGSAALAGRAGVLGRRFRLTLAVSLPTTNDQRLALPLKQPTAQPRPPVPTPGALVPPSGEPETFAAFEVNFSGRFCFSFRLPLPSKLRSFILFT
jgi:hypothetical protein